MTQPIPDAALDDRLGFLGTAGSGKTYAAKGRVERLLSMGHRVVIVDPLDVWFGLRLKTDGETPAFPVAILGGKHGDLPLNEHSGDVIGEAVARSTESCIVALTGLKTSAARQRFMLGFLDAIYERTDPELCEPYHLVFDEADLWAPQRPMGNETMLCHLMEEIVRRGRVKGFIPWLITQRPAVLNKNVLSQVDGLISLKLTSSQDRDAIGAWIEGQADRQQGKEILASLPTQPRGQGIVWLPGRNILATETFPENETFDSSRTPARGEKKRRTSLVPLDLPALKDRLATVEDEARENDPKALKDEIAKLKRELAAKPGQTDPKAMEEHGRQEYQRGFTEGSAGALRAMAPNVAAAIARFQETMEVLRSLQDGAPMVALPPIERPEPRPKPPKSNGHDTDRKIGAEQRPLAVLASMHPGGMTQAQWAVAAGLKRKSGTRRTYVSRLRVAGLIEQRGNLFYATKQGLSDLGKKPEKPPKPGRELVEFWANKISGAGPMLRTLAERYPKWTTIEDLAANLQISAESGTFRTYLSRLKTPELIERDDQKRVRASPNLMG